MTAAAGLPSVAVSTMTSGFFKKSSIARRHIISTALFQF
jgi:hypothetical protein